MSTSDKADTVEKEPTVASSDSKPASQSSELKVEHTAPMWWMESSSGALFPAFDFGGRAELESAGCKVSDKAPKGMPAATGGRG